MDEQTKRKMIRNYFKPFPKWTIWLILIGVIILFIGTQTSAGVAVAGVVLLGLGILGIVMYSKGKPTDQQIDEWLEEDLRQLDAKSLKKLGIDKTELVGDTVRIFGPILWSISGVSAQDLLFKKGKDGFVRFGVYKATIVQLTDKLIGAYQCIFNFLKNVALNEGTDEYFYKDVVSVTTKELSTSYVLPNGKKLINAETFALKVSSGDSVEVILRDPSLEEFTGGQIPATRAEKAIQTIRTILREKKA